MNYTLYFQDLGSLVFRDHLVIVTEFSNNWGSTRTVNEWKIAGIQLIL